MKINPSAIQSYQQINRTDSSRTFELNRPNTASTQTVQPQKGTNSPLAVQATGKSYAEMLTEPERAALELVFSKYRGTNAVAASPRETSALAQESLGRIIDVKV